MFLFSWTSIFPTLGAQPAAGTFPVLVTVLVDNSVEQHRLKMRRWPQSWKSLRATLAIAGLSSSSCNVVPSPRSGDLLLLHVRSNCFKQFLSQLHLKTCQPELNSSTKNRVSCIRVLAGYVFVYVFSCIYWKILFFVYVSCILLIV